MKADPCLLLARNHFECHLYFFCSGDNGNDQLVWKYLDSNVLLCSSPTHTGANAATWRTCKESMDFFWLITKHQLRKHRTKLKEEQIGLSWALEERMIGSEHELRFPTWDSSNESVRCLMDIWFGRGIFGPRPHCLGFSVTLQCDYCPVAQGLVQSVCRVSCCGYMFVTRGLWPTSLPLSSLSWCLRNR